MSKFKKAGFTDKTLFGSHKDVWWFSTDILNHAVELTNRDGKLLNAAFEELVELPRDQDGFYIWDGGERPVPGDWVVDVMFGDEAGKRSTANGWIWTHSGMSGDITAFRVISTGKSAPEWPEPEAEVPFTGEGLVFEEPEYTGGSVSYYRVHIAKPTTIKDPYDAECNDIIEALNMNYAEGNAFKAIWRRCAARQGKAKAGYKDGLYDAEKVVFFGGRMVEQEALERGE
jgi:hypothetical protein